MPLNKTLVFLLFAAFIFLAENTAAQSLPIAIDGQYDEWNSSALELTDVTNDDSGIDFLRCEVANDENFLFLQLELADEVNLTDNNEITLYFDTDLNANTGDFINGIGAELEINFANLEAKYELPGGNGFLDLHDLEFRHLPSVSAFRFEIAINRHSLSNAGDPIFIENGLRIFWKDEDGPNGDEMPDNGTIFTYQFDESPTADYEPIALEKEDPELVRLLTWNTLNNGLDDLDREDNFERVLAALQPEIVTFNECWDMNAPQVASFMNAAVPLGGFQSWHAVKLDQGNVTASRWPILQSWLILDNARLTASLIDMPDEDFNTDLLVINGHLRCCTADFDRQRRADAFIEFILDAKTSGGIIDLPENTPFVLSGDLNLVGESQQLTTILTGDIINSSIFGDDGPPDWDDTDLMDALSLQTDQRMAYTWENTFSDFPPSRIDFHIFSNSVMEVEKSYTLNTRIMPSLRLAQYGLQSNDTRFASDHLPKVSDLRLTGVTAVDDISAATFKLKISPNPAAEEVRASFESPMSGDGIFILQNMEGQVINTFEKEIKKGKNSILIDLPELIAGAYFMKIKMGEEFIVGKIIVQ